MLPMRRSSGVAFPRLRAGQAGDLADRQLTIGCRKKSGMLSPHPASAGRDQKCVPPPNWKNWVRS